MKKIILILAIALTACKKETVKPTPAPEKRDDVAINYRLFGMKNNIEGGDSVVCVNYYGIVRTFYNIPKIDSCAIYINDSLFSTKNYYYHLVSKKGDVIKFYLKGEVTDPGCNFAIWPDRNELPVITYFGGAGGVITGTYTVY